jgi:hypothetical protein
MPHHLLLITRPVRGIYYCVRIAIALLMSAGIYESAVEAATSSTFWFALPGGAAILYGNASNPQAPMSQRVWQQAVFRLPNGKTFRLRPRAGEPGAEVTQFEPPDESNISPSGQYVVVARIEPGTYSSGSGQAESVLSREYCSAIEIRTGCITVDQTGEICGAGWQAGQGERWGTVDQTDVMLRRDRPSTSRLLGFIRAGQPLLAVIEDDSGADNLLRCDPPLPVNREAYGKIAAALRAAGALNDARLIDAVFSSADVGVVGTQAYTAQPRGRTLASVATQKATLYTAPDEADTSRDYLVQNDTVTILKHSPAGWTYIDYVNASRKHLLRWIKSDQLSVK